MAETTKETNSTKPKETALKETDDPLRFIRALGIGVAILLALLAVAKIRFEYRQMLYRGGFI